jgi:hypothetical protein
LTSPLIFSVSLNDTAFQITLIELPDEPDCVDDRNEHKYKNPKTPVKERES